MDYLPKAKANGILLSHRRERFGTVSFSFLMHPHYFSPKVSKVMDYNYPFRLVRSAGSTPGGQHSVGFTGGPACVFLDRRALARSISLFLK